MGQCVGARLVAGWVRERRGSTPPPSFSFSSSSSSFFTSFGSCSCCGCCGSCWWASSCAVSKSFVSTYHVPFFLHFINKLLRKHPERDERKMIAKGSSGCHNIRVLFHFLSLSMHVLHRHKKVHARRRGGSRSTHLHLLNT